MPIPFLIPLAIQLAAKFAPTLVGKLTGSDKAEHVAEKVIDFAKGVTGKEDAEEAAKVLEANPELALKFQQALYTYELGIEQEQTKRLEAVNRTMQTEAVSGSVLQRIWRPINGLLFGFTIWCDYFVAQIVVPMLNHHFILNAAKFSKDTGIEIDPLHFIWDHVPMPVYVLWAGVLGVAVASRGKEKITKMRTMAASNGTTFGNLELLKEFGKGILGK